MIVAVTGSNGFIGQQLVRRFAESDWDVRRIVRRDIELGRLVNGFAGADIVVHAAGATRAPSTAQLRESNVALTERVLEAARQADVGRFVFVSSLAAAGPAQRLDAPADESMPALPIEAYGRSKLDAERAVCAMADLPFVIVRPAAVYGPGDRDFLELFRLARRRIAIHPANRDHWLSIIHVDDLADAIVCCATAEGAVGRVYCLGNVEPVQWAELFRLAARCSGRDLAIDMEVPALLVDAGAMVGDVIARVTGHAGLLTTEKVALSKARYWTCSSARAKRELGFNAAIPLEQGLCDTYRWYLDHDWL
jgi:nucleoside-diphosphate-sugar epimerase